MDIISKNMTQYGIKNDLCANKQKIIVSLMANERIVISKDHRDNYIFEYGFLRILTIVLSSIVVICLVDGLFVIIPAMIFSFYAFMIVHKERLIGCITTIVINCSDYNEPSL